MIICPAFICKHLCRVLRTHTRRSQHYQSQVTISRKHDASACGEVLTIQSVTLDFRPLAGESHCHVAGAFVNISVESDTVRFSGFTGRSDAPGYAWLRGKNS